jgi:hypothetical protein
MLGFLVKVLSVTDLRLEISVGKSHLVHDAQSFQQLYSNRLRIRFHTWTGIENEFVEVPILKVFHYDKNRVCILKPA